MEFDTYVKECGFDPATLSEQQRKGLTASWKHACASKHGGGEAADPPPYEQRVQAIEAEAKRVADIEAVGIRAMEDFGRSGRGDKISQVKELLAHARADTAVGLKDFQLSMIRLGRADAVNPIARPDADLTGRVVEAAFCRTAQLKDLEKTFDAPTLEAADRHFGHGLSLVELMAYFARRNGWRGHSLKAAVQTEDFFRAAFARADGDGAWDIRAGTSGPSTYTLPNILSNVANKFLWVGFNAVDSTWSRICSRRPVNDFKTNTTVGAVGGFLYKKLAPSGEIQHDSPGEVVYTNKADTYAIMLGIARPDLINDDTGALSGMGMRVGRGAALKINDIFWTVFLNNSSFFTSGNLNVSTGGGSALGSADGAAINAAEVKFLNQTDPDGLPLAVMPTTMLVPPTLRNTAARWMGSQLFTPSGTSGLGATNIFGGRYVVESSPYMENSAYTGNSTAAWYLLANPSDLSAIEGVFLNGKDTPTVDTAQADFNQLGIQMRGYIDFGFALHEYRAGVRSAGS